jgi:hypothetical protein
MNMLQETGIESYTKANIGYTLTTHIFKFHLNRPIN